MPDLSTFTLFVFILVLTGIGKDIVVFSRFVEKWLRTRGNGDPKSPASVEVLMALMDKQSRQISLEVRDSLDRHVQALMAENRKTNELLTKFLIGQRIIAKTLHGIDLDI